EPAYPRAYARGESGAELPPGARRAGYRHPPTHRQAAGRSVRPGHTAAQLPEVCTGTLLCRHTQAYRLARWDALWPAQRPATARQAAVSADDRAFHGAGL